MTPAQITLVKNAIAADGVMSQQPAGDIGTLAIMQWLNTVDATYYVWKSTTPKSEIHGAISWKNLTPTFNPLTDTGTVFTNSTNVCLSRQQSLTNLFLGGDALATGLTNIHQAFQDALTDIPSGAGGALQQGGWGVVKTAITRNATRLEKILSSTDAAHDGTFAKPADLVYEGQISLSDTKDIRNAA